MLLADRGRGKSAALGIAAAQLLQGQARRIGVTGSNRQSVDCVFKHAKLEGLQGRGTNSLLRSGQTIGVKSRYRSVAGG